MSKALSIPLRGWQALQPAIYLISVIPVLWWFSARTEWNQGIWLLTAGLGVTLLQHAVNVFNDANDWNRGADSEKGNSWVRYHDFNVKRVFLHATLSLIAGVTVGLTALIATQKIWVLAAASPWLVLGLLYNLGPSPFAYSRWGELVTGLCYGSVFACLWLTVPAASPLAAVLSSLGCGCLAVAVLLAHQPPQILTDAAAGKKTHAVIHGAKTTYRKARWLFRASLIFFGFSLFPMNKFPALSLAVLLAALLLGADPKLKDSPKHYLMRTTGLIGAYLAIRVVLAFSGGSFL